MTKIKKVIQTSKIERKDYKRELNKFFANYRATLTRLLVVLQQS